MLKEWAQFSGFKILSYFLNYPNSSIYINDLARKISVSPSSVLKYCNSYYKEGILFREKKANAIFFSLNNNSVFVKSFKKSHFLGLILNSSEFSTFIEKNNSNLVSLILYGSYSSGNYSEDSDIDLLVIYNSDKIDFSNLLKLEKTFKKEINITKMSLTNWIDKINKKDNFAISILKNNVNLWGADINES